MARKIVKLGLKREKNHLYYIGKDGNVWAAPMARAGKKGGKAKIVAYTGVKKEKGFLYFLDKNGDVAEAAMSLDGKKRRSNISKIKGKKRPNIADRSQNIKVNILVCGKTGVGKTSLIQSICGKRIVPDKRISHAVPETKNFIKYEFDRFVFWDSPGFEPGENREQYVKRIRSFIHNQHNKRPNDRIHLLWYCISGEGARVTDFDKIVKEKFLLPVFVAITKDDITSKKQRKKMKEVFDKKIFHRKMLVLTSSDKKTGIDKLLKMTNKALPEGVNAGKKMSRRIWELNRSKKAEVNSIIKWAAARGAGCATLSPWPLADIGPLMANEGYMILRIGNAYGIPVTESMISGFLGMIAASLAGKTIASFFPGVKIIIAVVVTYGVGKAAQRWFEEDMQMSEAEIKTIFRKSCASYKR